MSARGRAKRRAVVAAPAIQPLPGDLNRTDKIRWLDTAELESAAECLEWEAESLALPVAIEEDYEDDGTDPAKAVGDLARKLREICAAARKDGSVQVTVRATTEQPK